MRGIGADQANLNGTGGRHDKATEQPIPQRQAAKIPLIPLSVDGVVNAMCSRAEAHPMFNEIQGGNSRMLPESHGAQDRHAEQDRGRGEAQNRGKRYLYCQSEGDLQRMIAIGRRDIQFFDGMMQRVQAPEIP